MAVLVGILSPQWTGQTMPLLELLLNGTACPNSGMCDWIKSTWVQTMHDRMGHDAWKALCETNVECEADDQFVDWRGRLVWTAES